MATSQPDAIDLLKNDHDSVKDLFDRFKKVEDRRAKAKIASQALNALKIHAVLEEEIFYPAVRQRVGKDVMNEADEEHHVAKVLMLRRKEELLVSGLPALALHPMRKQPAKASKRGRA